VSTNLIDLLGREFTGDVLGKVAAAVGESERTVQSAIAGVAPALVAALTHRASTSRGLTELFEAMQKGGFDGTASPSLASYLEGRGTLGDLIARGAPLVASLLGAREADVTNWLASFASVPSRSASSLMSLATPVLLSLLSAEARKGGGFTQAVIGSLLGSQGGLLRDRAPAGLASALGLADFSGFGPGSAHRTPAAPHRAAPAATTGANWWPWLALAAVALLAWWLLAGRTPEGTLEPRVSIANHEGKVTCSATVRDEETRQAILKSVRLAFGDATACDIVVDRNVKVIAWLPNLDRIIAAIKRPGTEFLLEANKVQVGGWLSAVDRKAIMDELRAIFGSGYTVAEHAVDRIAEYIAAAKGKSLTALSAIESAFSPSGFIDAMNLAVINFATGSAEIPAGDQDLIDRAAAVLKSAPAGTMIEIGGHTDSTGDPASNLKLSEDRANAVRNALISKGVGGSMLVAKGYGDTKPVASNDTEYGRFRNRRIEYSALPLAAK
jgi:outer membrane protein OmpA-like peptidoglycan-associated protein